MTKRLLNSLQVVNLKTERAPTLLKWLSSVVKEESKSFKSLNGSLALYVTKRNKKYV